MHTMSQPLVSILIPLYNQERYFKACIRSVERQTTRILKLSLLTMALPTVALRWHTTGPLGTVASK